MSLEGFDSSVVLRLLIGEPEEQAQRAMARLNAIVAGGGQVVVSDMVVSEVYFALQYHYDVPKAEAIEVIRSFLESPEIACPGVVEEVIARRDLARANPGLVDRIIHAEYRRAGFRMATFEKASRKLPGVSVL